MADLTDFIFLEWIVSIITIGIPIWLATRYHTRRQHRNTKRYSKLDPGKAESFKLKEDKRIYFYCRVERVKKAFVIKKGAIFLRQKKYCFIKLKDTEEIPARIDLLFGIEDENVLVLKLPFRKIEKSSFDWREAEVEAYDLPSKAKEAYDF